ncbi:MAG TPA: rod shape-determining protein MreC [Thermodesulfobacteriota bacterium]|nr:rod shape-determining protein MreC [Thermodesulfobacteriota bacterium]
MSIFSRKYGFPFFVFLVLLAVSLYFFYNLKRPPGFRFIEPGAFSVVSYFQKTINTVFSFPVHVWERYVFLIETEKKNQILNQEIKMLRQENVLLQESALANQRLRKLLEFKKNNPHKLAVAEVVGVDASLYFESFSINKGRNEGIKKGMAVLCPDGAVGRILREADSFSVVLLLIDQGFALDALIQRTRTQGVVEGIGGGFCQMKYVLGSEDVRLGDWVIASGLEGFFPKGTIVGKIVSLKKDKLSAFQEVIIRPMVNFKKTEEVFVVLDLAS